MIMSSNVKIWDLEPEIKIDVVLLTSLESFIIFATRASYDEELVVEAANGVSVASILHIIHAEAVEDVGVVINDLEALLE